MFFRRAPLRPRNRIFNLHKLLRVGIKNSFFQSGRSLTTTICGRMTGKGPERAEVSAPVGGNNIWKASLRGGASLSGTKVRRRMRSLEGNEAESWWSSRERCVTFASPYHPWCHLAHKRKSGFEMKWNFNQCGLLEEVSWVCRDDAGVIRGSPSRKPFKARIEMWVSNLMEDLKAVIRRCQHIWMENT